MKVWRHKIAVCIASCVLVAMHMLTGTEVTTKAAKCRVTKAKVTLHIGTKTNVMYTAPCKV